VSSCMSVADCASAPVPEVAGEDLLEARPVAVAAFRAAGLRAGSGRLAAGGPGTRVVLAAGQALPVTGELMTFCHPVVTVPAVVTAAGAVLAGGWLPDGSRMSYLNAPGGKAADRLPVRVAEHNAVLAPLPPAVAGMISAAVAEYEAGETLEARCARDADKLDCLLQAREYQEQGHANVQPWIDTSVAVLATSSAKQIAHEAITQNSLSWLERAKQAAAGDH
jgi:HD domain